jgi:hypothetical protein
VARRFDDPDIKHGLGNPAAPDSQLRMLHEINRLGALLVTSEKPW